MFHNLGHFQAFATYEKIRGTHFWKNMIKQIIKFISRWCLVCQRNDRVVPINHPALAIEVTGIFDRVGIDLAFGFPITSEGF